MNNIFDLMKKNKPVIKNNFLWLYLFFFFSSCVSAPPLPENLQVVPPESDLLPEVAAFSGIWEGKWADRQDVVIVVEKINKNRANIIISNGGLVNGFGLTENTYYSYTATVQLHLLPPDFVNAESWIYLYLGNPSEIEEGKYQCPCYVKLEMNKKLNQLIATIHFINGG
jgi:hypothetical protein